MKTPLRMPAVAGAWLVAGLTAATSLHAEVRFLTLGIDVNCPPGLAECWGQGVAEGVARMNAIALIADEADGASQTAEVRTRGDQLISINDLALHMGTIGMGARLRAIEATVDGWLEKRDGLAVLRISRTDETLRLGPLTAKAQWDRRKESAFPATAAERKAYETLLKDWHGEREAMRITGPLRASEPDAELTLEVREWYRFGVEPPAVPSLSLGIRVNSPYGLGEPWVEARESLEQFAGLERVAEFPDADASTAEVWLRDRRMPDLRQLDEHLGRAGIGAKLMGIEAVVEGRLGRERGQLVLKLADPARTLPLAPLTRKVQWDYRLHREAAATTVERNGYARLLAKAGSRSRLVRVSGPLVQTPDGDASVLEVREFDLNPRASGALAGGRLRDTTPPVPKRSLRAIAREAGIVFLDWGNSDEPDFAGFNVYRRTTPVGRFKKINRSLLTESEFEVKGAALTDQFVVTVVDRAGNESDASPIADARPPAAPANLAATPGDSAVHLRWDEVDEPDFDTYSIYRSETPDGPFAEICVGVPTGSYSDTGAENGRMYYYVVTAVDGSSMESAFSNAISIRLATKTAPPTGITADALRLR